MTARKPKPTVVTVPVIPADEAFSNDLAAKRDAAVIEEQALQQQYIALEAHFEREAVRLEKDRRAKLGAIAVQIGQQQRISSGAEAAIDALMGGNVVAMAAE